MQINKNQAKRCYPRCKGMFEGGINPKKEKLRFGTSKAVYESKTEEDGVIVKGESVFGGQRDSERVLSKEQEGPQQLDESTKGDQCKGVFESG